MNLTFINPALLWILPVSLLPIIIHLFFQQKPKLIKFSYLKFILLATKTVQPRKKLLEWLLLLLRCLILFLLCLAFTRPVGFFGTYGGKKNQQIVLLLDVSYSMSYSESGRTRLMEAKNITDKLLDALLPTGKSATKVLNKQISIVTFSDRINEFTKFTNDINSLKKFLATVEQTYYTTNLISAVSFAYDTFQELPAGERTIIVISDNAKHILPEEKKDIKTLIPDYDSSVRLVFIPAAGTDICDNTSINKLEISGKVLRFTSEIENFSSIRTNWSISMFKDNKRTYDNLLTIQPFSKLNYEFAYTKDIEEVLTGKLELQEDSLTTDDIYYFVHQPEKDINVLIIDGDPKLGGVNRESYYLESALRGETVEKNSGFSVTICSPEEFEKKDIIRYDVLIFCNVEKVAEIETKEEQMLIFFLGDKVSPEDYPDWLRENIHGRQKGEFRIGSIDKNSAVLSKFDEFETDKIKFSEVYELGDIDSNVIMRLNNDMPLLIEKKFESKEIFIFGSSADRDWTNFPAKTFYPYFVRALCKYMSKTTTDKDSFTAGETVRYNFEGRVRNADVILPEGTGVEPAKVIYGAGGDEIEFSKTDYPGIYLLRYELSGRQSKRYFSVNADRSKSESDTTLIKPDRLKEFFTRAYLLILENDSSLSRKVVNIIEGEELTKNFLLFALLFLGMELLVAYKSK